MPDDIVQLNKTITLQSRSERNFKYILLIKQDFPFNSICTGYINIL